jgi:hypothetical protein
MEVQMQNTVLGLIDAFPVWFQITLVAVWGLALLAVPFRIILKFAVSPEVRAVLATTAAGFSRTALYLQEQARDPIRYPRIERAFIYLSMVYSYVLSLWLLASFTLILLLWQFSTKNFSVVEHLGLGLFCVAAMFMASVLKAQGGRELAWISTD